jgi:rod shape-determining protein MreD
VSGLLVFSFFLAVTGFFFQLLLPSLPPFSPYIPWIAYVLLKSPLHKALWLAAFVGLLVDLFSDHPFGTHPISYVLSAACGYRIANRFSADSPLHLAIYSSLISLLSILFHLFLLFLFDRRVPFSGKWAIGEFIGLSLVDGIYALIWFAWPGRAALFLKRHWTVFWLKRNHTSTTTQKSP